MRTLIIAGLLTCIASLATAQSSSTEDRLREVARKATIDMRAAQDSQAATQATLDQTQKERDALKQQVAALTEQMAQRPAEAAPAAAAPAPAPPAEGPQLRASVDALKRQNADLEAGLKKWQAAYQQAAVIAQAKDAESRQLAASDKSAQATLAICQSKNTRLLATGMDILHLYRQGSFKSLLLESYEPMLGFKKVELENIVQDNEDKLRAEKYYPGEQAPASKPAAQ